MDRFPGNAPFELYRLIWFSKLSAHNRNLTEVGLFDVYDKGEGCTRLVQLPCTGTGIRDTDTEELLIGMLESLRVKCRAHRRQERVVRVRVESERLYPLPEARSKQNMIIQQQILMLLVPETN